MILRPTTIRTRTRRFILAAILLVASLPLLAQEQTTGEGGIELAELVAAALEASRDISDAAIRTRLAEIARDSVLDTVTPELTLTADPAYGLRTQRGSNFAEISDIAEFPPEPTTTVTQSTGLTLSAVQLLSTGGVVNGSVGSGLSATVSDAASDASTTTYALSPQVSLSISQPLFVDGKLIDATQLRLNRESANNALATAQLGEAAVREQITVLTVQLALQRESLRRAALLQRSQQALLELQLDDARVRQNQGQGSQQQILALEVQLNRSRDAELQSMLAARELALQLRELTGVSLDENEPIAIPASAGPGAADGQCGRSADESSLPISQAERELRSAELDYELARKQAGATANLAVTATPRYRDEREDPADLGTVFSDFSGDGSGVDLNLVLTLEVPLTAGGERRRTVEQARLSLDLAESALERARVETESQEELLELRMDTLSRRIELLEFDLAYERDLLTNDRELLELGSRNQINVEQREFSVQAKEIDLANLRGELLLQRLELARVVGKDPAAFVLDSVSE